MSTSSGKTTPTKLDNSANSIMSENDTCRDSKLNYELGGNWSMIFTDDNNSTDHDLRSNCSSGDENDASIIQDVISETESESPFFESVATENAVCNYKRKNSTLNIKDEEGGNSVSTLKPSKSSETHLKLPDPLNSSRVKKNSKKTEEENGPNKPPSFFAANSYRQYILYFVLVFLFFDRLVQILSPAIIDYKTLELRRGKEPLFTEFVTTTETVVVPGTVSTIFSVETITSTNHESNHGISNDDGAFSKLPMTKLMGMFAVKIRGSVDDVVSQVSETTVALSTKIKYHSLDTWSFLKNYDYREKKDDLLKDINEYWEHAKTYDYEDTTLGQVTKPIREMMGDTVNGIYGSAMGFDYKGCYEYFKLQVAERVIDTSELTKEAVVNGVKVGHSIWYKTSGCLSSWINDRLPRSGTRFCETILDRSVKGYRRLSQRCFKKPSGRFFAIVNKKFNQKTFKNLDNFVKTAKSNLQKTFRKFCDQI